MRERMFNTDLLIKLQQVVWYAVLVYFAVLSALFMLEFEGVFNLAAYGIIFIIVTTGLKLVIMAEQFRKAGRRKFWALAYFLVVILAAIVAGDYFL